MITVPHGRLTEARLIRRLHSLGALSPDSAQPIDLFGFVQRRRLDFLLSRGVVRRVGEERYYVDDDAYARLRAARRRIAVPLAIVVVLLVALLVLMD